MEGAYMLGIDRYVNIFYVAVGGEVPQRLMKSFQTRIVKLCKVVYRYLLVVYVYLCIHSGLITRCL